MDKKSTALSKDKSQKRKKVLQDMMKTILFYEAKGKPVKNNKKPSSKKNKSVQKEKSNREERPPYKARQKESSLIKKVDLTEEEKKALNNLVVEIQKENFDEKITNIDKQKKDSTIIDEMHEVSYEEEEQDTLQDRFLNFDTEFDAGMLWEDTDLDDYKDLFTERELEILKEKGLRKLYYYSSQFEVSEATVSADLEAIEGWLANYGLIVSRKPGSGISIEGS